MNPRAKIRQLLDRLNEGRIDGVADLIRDVGGFTKDQLSELADLFDQTLPHSHQDQFKLVLRRRAGGNRSRRPGFAKERAYHFGWRIHRIQIEATSSGTKITRKEAINILAGFIGPTEYGEIPSNKTLDRDYDYFHAVQKANAHSHIIVVWPQLLNKKPSTPT